MNTPSSSSFGEPSNPNRTIGDTAAANPVLSDASAQAADALFSLGFEADVSDNPGARKLASLLKLLDVPAATAANRELLIDLTMARVARAAHTRRVDTAAGSFVEGDLSPEDDDALEALVEAGMDISRVPSSMRARASRQLALLGLLQTPADLPVARNDLVSRTLATVQEHIERDESRMELAAVGQADDESVGGFRPRFRLGDLVTVAAMLLIGFGVLAPITNAVQGYSRRADCQANLSAAGLGFGLYAGSHKDSLPMASASPVGATWWNVGVRPDQSNAANLYTLVRGKHVSLADLACAGNRHAVAQQSKDDAMDWGGFEEVSYSFQNLFAAERPTWSGSSRLVVLVDRSPVVLKAYQRQVIDPTENSPNHGGKGQAALFNDGSVEWLKSPVLENGDNIWLPRTIEHAIRMLSQPRAADPLHGDENPAGVDDVFVGP